MSINIQQAEDYLCAIIPDVAPLCGEISTTGTYLLFNTITVNNSATENVSYNFSCYVAAPDTPSGKTQFYNTLNDTLSGLLKAEQTEQQIEIREMQSRDHDHLMVAQLDIAVTPLLHTEEV